MDLYEAIDLLGLEPLIDTDYTSKDVEKCFRKQALRHHPDKGGDASYFQLLHKAKDILLDHVSGNLWIGGNNSGFETNSTAVSTSLYEHRTCIRQVLVIRGAVVAATDDGLIVIELKQDTNCRRLERVVSFAAHREDCSFLCCASSATTTDGYDLPEENLVYAGTKDGFVHQIDLSKRRLTPWKLPSRERIVAISSHGDWVAIATADGGIFVIEYQDGGSTPTMVWNVSLGKAKGVARGKKRAGMSPETVLLEKGASHNSLNLWVGGGSSSDNSNDMITGRLLMWELDPEVNFFERHENDEMGGLFEEYDLTDSSSASSGSEANDIDNDEDCPVIDVVVQEGPIFSLCKHKQTIAVVSGQCILVWEHEAGKQLQETKTIRIGNDRETLYTVCLNEGFLAAAGSGESIMVWERETWTMAHHLPLQKGPCSGCCLATNCIMTLDWFHKDSGILISGGYDGVVTMWALANRLEEGGGRR